MFKSNEDNILYFSEFSNLCVDNIYQNNLTIGKRYVCTCIVIEYHAKVITYIVSFTLTEVDNSHDYHHLQTTDDRGGGRNILLNLFSDSNIYLKENIFSINISV